MESEQPTTRLDSEACRRARLSRDPRFDGEFFLGVISTGIYCRPICPARLPAEKNVRYFASAALAASAGFRPCLRCRPESAPNSPAWQGSGTTLRRALRLIDEGALNSDGVPALAERLGIGERYLRKLFQRELGISPTALALNQRLLFAKKLLAETRLPVTEVAFAAGFGSVRRFNSAVRNHFQLAPGALRRRAVSGTTGDSVRLQMQFRPPYDWDGVVAFFARHAIDGLEQVSDSEYRRPVRLVQGAGEIQLRPKPGKTHLELQVTVDRQQLLMPIVARVRRMFDLDANPAAIAEVLGREQPLRSLVERYPGIRAPGYWSLWEASLRAIVGQQISTEAARGILGRFTRAVAISGPPHFPRPHEIASLPDTAFPMPGRRRDSIRALCSLYATHGEPTLESIEALPGIGPWTSAMVAIRGGGDPDALPLSDLGLIKAWDALGADETLKSSTSNWRPWRSYAANLLWRSL